MHFLFFFCFFLKLNIYWLLFPVITSTVSDALSWTWILLRRWRNCEFDSVDKCVHHDIILVFQLWHKEKGHLVAHYTYTNLPTPGPIPCRFQENNSQSSHTLHLGAACSVVCLSLSRSTINTHWLTIQNFPRWSFKAERERPSISAAHSPIHWYTHQTPCA